jgi:hypothetical protein
VVAEGPKITYWLSFSAARRRLVRQRTGRPIHCQGPTPRHSVFGILLEIFGGGERCLPFQNVFRIY